MTREQLYRLYSKKESFVDELDMLVSHYDCFSGLSVYEMRYVNELNSDGKAIWERVDITFWDEDNQEPANTIKVCVTGDNCAGILSDITKALEYYKEHGEYL